MKINKTILISAIALLSPLSAFAADIVSVSPTSISSDSSLVSITSAGWESYQVEIFAPVGSATETECVGAGHKVCNEINGDRNAPFATDMLGFSHASDGTYTMIVVDTSVGSFDYQAGCEDVASTIETCEAGAWFTGEVHTLSLSSNAFGASIDNATTNFERTTGININGVVSWAGDNLIKLFIGSGLAFLYMLRGWIVAFLILGAIVYFAYRGFRFMRH